MLDTDRRLMSILEQFFEIAPMPVDAVLGRCAELIAQTIAAEKVDAFLHDPTSGTLVAIGTNHNALAQLQRKLGLDRLPLANADPIAKVFETGIPYDNGHIERDPQQPRGVVEALGVRSMLAVALNVGGTCRGVISAASQKPEAFSQADFALLKLVAMWVGSLVHRSELMIANAARAREQAQRATAEELITVLAHDLRNLLAPIVSRAAVMLERARQAGREQEVADGERLIASLQRVTELMADLLDGARIDRDMLALRSEPMDLIEVLRAIAQEMSLPNVSVQLENSPSQLLVFADRQRLTQALENVISNATKYSPRDLPVTIHVEPTQLDGVEAVKIAVVDRGPGIAPELLPRVFDRYVSGAKASGLGLGLYLARAIVVAHGGSIALHSNVSSGTRCELLLPLALTASA